jgi:hypothetical protein
LFNIGIDFLEDRNKSLKFDRSSLAMIRGKDYIGDLARIQKDFMSIGKSRDPSTNDKILTSTPTSLLTQIRHLCDDRKEEESIFDQKENEIFKNFSSKNVGKKLVEEIAPENESLANQQKTIQQTDQKDLKSKVLDQKGQTNTKQKELKDNEPKYQKSTDRVLTGDGESIIAKLEKIVPINEDKKVINAIAFICNFQTLIFRFFIHDSWSEFNVLFL